MKEIHVGLHCSTAAIKNWFSYLRVQQFLGCTQPMFETQIPNIISVKLRISNH